LFCSTFQYPLFPFTHSNEAYGIHNNITDYNHTSLAHNIIHPPLPANTKGADFQQAISQDWLPALKVFKPQLILISAGFDGHSEDEISQIVLTEIDYRWVTDQIKNIANEYSDGKVVSILEGCYALNALGRCVVAHINGLIAN